MYVEIMAEQGIVGLLLFIYLFYQALINAWNLFYETEDSFFKALGLGVFISILVTMTTNFFGDHWTYIELGAFYWTFTALAARANIMTEEEKEEEEEGQAEAAGEA